MATREEVQAADDYLDQICKEYSSLDLRDRVMTLGGVYLGKKLPKRLKPFADKVRKVYDMIDDVMLADLCVHGKCLKLMNIPYDKLPDGRDVYLDEEGNYTTREDYFG